MKKLTRPAWLEIDLDNLINNYKEIKNFMNEDSELMAVVKADAYETGAIQIVKELMNQGVRYFGVAHLSEALHIRKYFKEPRILIMGYTPDYLIQKSIEEDIDTTVYLLEQAEFISEVAKKLGKEASIHIKIETGMNRLGLMPTDESIKIIQKIYRLDNLNIAGIFTHFAVSDEEDPSYTFEQVKKFDYVIDGMKELGLKIPIRHISNSAAIMRYPELNYDMARAGFILYGLYTSSYDSREVSLKSILSIKAQISNVKELEKGQKISYGLTYETSKKSKIATVPIGYADGFSRQLSNKGNAIVNDTIVPIVGRICMDQLMLDVTGLDVKIGDKVVLMGRSGDKEITIEEIAQKIGGIPAEVFCMMNKRIPRVYMKYGKIEEVVDYLLEI